MKENPLVSIIVLSYKNTEYLSFCLNSIFTQTYDNIELIITNDCSEDFDEKTVSLYVVNNKTDNISSVIINKNERNMGTVRNCNIALSLSSGDYVMIISSDDAYNNKSVIEDMVTGFKSLPQDVMSIVGQTEMRDRDLDKCIKLYTDANTQKLINELTPLELYENHLAHNPIFPSAARIYKKEVFEKYGGFDERYFLVEDWSSSISFAKQGMRTYYLDILCVNHRAEGVSSSPGNPNSYAQKMFLLDMIAITANTLKDNSASEAAKIGAKRRYDWYTKRFYELFGIPIDLVRKINLTECSTLKTEQTLTELEKAILENEVNMQQFLGRCDANQKIKSLEGEIYNAEERLRQFETATFWKLTKPLRIVADMVKRIILSKE